MYVVIIIVHADGKIAFCREIRVNKLQQYVYIHKTTDSKKTHLTRDLWLLLFCYITEGGVRGWALFGMELLCRIASKVLQERCGHEMLSVRLSELVDLCQEFVSSVGIDKPEWP